MSSFWRRQRLFIDRLQLKLMAINLLYLGVLALIFSSVTFGPHVYTLYNRDASIEAQRQAADSMLMLHSTIWPPLVVVALIFFYHSMVYSHRIAGPLYRFRKVFEEVQDGNLRARAVLRTRDLLHREAQALNSMVEATEERVEGVAHAVDAVHITVQDIQAGSRFGACNVPIAVIAHLAGRVEAIRGRLDGFRLASSDRRDVPPITAEREPETDSRPTSHA